MISSHAGILRLPPNRDDNDRYWSHLFYIDTLQVGQSFYCRSAVTSALLNATWKKARPTNGPFYPSFYHHLFFLHAIDDEPHGVSYTKITPGGKPWSRRYSEEMDKVYMFSRIKYFNIYYTLPVYAWFIFIIIHSVIIDSDSVHERLSGPLLKVA